MVLPRNSVIFSAQVHASIGDIDNSVSYFESNNIRDQEDYFANKYYASVQTIELASSDDGGDDSGFFGIIDKLQELWSTLMGLRSWLEDSNRENSKKLADFFNIDSQLRGSEHIGNNDGTMSLLLKGQIGRLSNNIDDSLEKYLGAVSGAEGSKTIYEYSDSPIVKVLKGQTTRMVDAINTIDLDEYLGAVSGAEGSKTIYEYSDSPIVKVLKGQTTRMVDAINTIDLDEYLGAVSGAEGSKTIYEYSDSPIVKVLKGQTTRMVDAINNQTSKDYTNLLKDIEKAIKNINSTPAGATIWDFLTSLVNGLTDLLTGILDFLNNLLDFLFHALIPEDTSFIDEWFDDLSTKFDEKFSVIDDLRITLTTAFEIKEREFEDKYIEIDILGTRKEIKFLDGTYLNMAIPYIRKFLSAIMILITMIFAYQKITGRGGVIE